MRTITITISEEVVNFIYELHAAVRSAKRLDAESFSRVRLGVGLGLGEAKEETETEEETSPHTPFIEEEREKEEKGRGRVSREGAKDSSVSKKEKPSYDEVCEYMEARGITSFQPMEFYSYYESRGWTIEDGVPLRKWKAAIVQWDIRRRAKTLRPTCKSSSPKSSSKPPVPQNRVVFEEAKLPDQTDAISYDEYLRRKRTGDPHAAKSPSSSPSSRHT